MEGGREGERGGWGCKNEASAIESNALFELSTEGVGQKSKRREGEEGREGGKGAGRDRQMAEARYRAKWEQ